MPWPRCLRQPCTWLLLSIAAHCGHTAALEIWPMPMPRQPVSTSMHMPGEHAAAPNDLVRGDEDSAMGAVSLPPVHRIVNHRPTLSQRLLDDLKGPEIPFLLCTALVVIGVVLFATSLFIGIYGMLIFGVLLAVPTHSGHAMTLSDDWRLNACVGFFMLSGLALRGYLITANIRKFHPAKLRDPQLTFGNVMRLALRIVFGLPTPATITQRGLYSPGPASWGTFSASDSGSGDGASDSGGGGDGGSDCGGGSDGGGSDCGGGSD